MTHPSTAQAAHNACLECAPRRHFLTGLLATSSAAVLPGCASTSKDAPLPAQAKRALVDVHHHVWAPAFLKGLEANKLAEAPGRNW